VNQTKQTKWRKYDLNVNTLITLGGCPANSSRIVSKLNFFMKSCAQKEKDRQ
jgi:hypothetical protein